MKVFRVQLPSVLRLLALLAALPFSALAPPAEAAPPSSVRQSRQELLEQMQRQQSERSGTATSAPPSAQPARPARGPAAADIGTDIPDSEVPRDFLLPQDIARLDRGDHNWNHLRTDHFVVHYARGRKAFAAKVARLAESFYSYISADLPPGTKDRMGVRLSHIFVFADTRAWLDVLGTTSGLSALTVSFVRGQTMYLQEYGDSTNDKMSVLAHEMTHLVMNRFLEVRLPLWLNEGLAEYYGEFAYRAVRGIGQSNKSAAFPPTKNLIPLDILFVLSSYPPDPVVLHFYRTSKYLIGFLRSKKHHPPECWNAYFAAVASGAPSTEALLSAFSYPDVPTLEKAFLKFPR
jgi:hypothetical protein